MKRIDRMVRKNMALLLSAALVWANMQTMGLAVPGRMAWAAVGHGVSGIPETASGSDADWETLETASSSDVDWEDDVEEWELATASNLMLLSSGDAIEELWKRWTATDFRFLDGSRGKGTAGQPYQIGTKAQLMALSQLASLGMKIGEGDLESDAYVGDYEGAYFELMSDINLAGMDWMPIGFYQNEEELSGEVPHPFTGHFDGNGHTVSNYRLIRPDWDHAGLFGAVVDGTISNLHVRISDTLTAGDRVGILAGYLAGRSSVHNCTVKGNVRGNGLVGGVAGYASGAGRLVSVIEDCRADVTLDSSASAVGRQVSVGGIAGQAEGITIVDCQVETADNASASIRGKGYVGGITGWQNDADLFNVFVTSGTIGGNGSEAIGGITGHYTAGAIKVARVAASIGSSGLGNYAHEGAFIGDKGSGCNFTYGTAATDDLAYLFTDTEAKLGAGVCGSDVPDDNRYPYDAHVGFWHSGDLYFTLRQEGKTKRCSDRYFYEELENGILNIVDETINGEEVPFAVNHVAPDSTGRPKRGYLISVPQIDTVAGGTHFYDVAALTVTGNGAYYRPIDREHRGAVAEGCVVTVATSPKNTNTEKYQMSGVPFYTEGGVQKPASYVTGGQYTFLMPGNDTEVAARYKRVAADIRVEPAEYSFRVVQTRTGSRKAPTLTTTVIGNSGNEIARYVNGVLAGAQVLPVKIYKTVDTNDDVADSRVLWSVDDPSLIRLLDNEDRDGTGYTDQSAGIQVKLDGAFFTDIIQREEKKQADAGYRYAIPATIYGAGHAGGGVAVLTAATRSSESFEGKPCTAQCRVKVTFQILDQTYVDLEDVGIDRSGLEFVVTRTLTGSRRAPVEKLEVTPAQTLTGSFSPDFFSEKEISWTVEDSSLAAIAADPDNRRAARVTAVSDARWIRDIIEADTRKKEAHPDEKAEGKGERSTRVILRADDKNGAIRTAFCTVTVRLVTVDQTGIASGGSSGGSGGGGGGGGSSSGITPAGTTKSSAVPAGAITGVWVQDAAGRWLFTGNGRTFAGEWAYIHNPYALPGQDGADWFFFDGLGYMMTGWYTNPDGHTYFLHDVSDGGRGRMYTGWHWIDGNCYYFQETQDETRGRLLKNAVTPDGYTTGENGAWTVDGVVQRQES